MNIRKVKIQWLGMEATRVAPEANGEKVEMKPKDILEVNEDVAKKLVSANTEMVYEGDKEAIKKAKARAARKKEQLERVDKEREEGRKLQEDRKKAKAETQPAKEEEEEVEEAEEEVVEEEAETQPAKEEETEKK